MNFSRRIPLHKKTLTIIVFGFLFLFFLNLNITSEQNTYTETVYMPFYKAENANLTSDNKNRIHNNILGMYYDSRESWTTSNLGSILFKNIPIEVYENRNGKKQFVVLVWKYFDWLKHRHIHSFGSSENNPLELCSVKNCIFTGDDSQIGVADALVIHLQHGLLPKVKDRNPKQRWIFLSDESPKHSFSLSKNRTSISEFVNVFNWSMTYRSDSDVPVPYGRTVPLSAPRRRDKTFRISKTIPHWKEKQHDVLVTVLMSNCNSPERNNYIDELQKHIKIDIYGKCSKDNKQKDRCPGHFKSDCDVTSKYLFYLVFENSKCREYLTEKVFQHAFSKGAIPVIMGPPEEDCRKLLPPHSYIHVDNFKKPEQLAKAITTLSNDTQILLMYHWWRNNFAVVNEHGYFGSKSYHFCRVCEALNYNDKNVKIYDEFMLRKFLDPLQSCW